MRCGGPGRGPVARVGGRSRGSGAPATGVSPPVCRRRPRCCGPGRWPVRPAGRIRWWSGRGPWSGGGPRWLLLEDLRHLECLGFHEVEGFLSEGFLEFVRSAFPGAGPLPGGCAPARGRLASQPTPVRPDGGGDGSAQRGRVRVQPQFGRDHPAASVDPQGPAVPRHPAVDQADDGARGGEGAQPPRLFRAGGRADDHGCVGATGLVELSGAFGLFVRLGRLFQGAQQGVEPLPRVLRMNSVRDGDRGPAAGPVQLRGQRLEQPAPGGCVALDGDQARSGGQIEVDAGVVRHADGDRQGTEVRPGAGPALRQRVRLREGKLPALRARLVGRLPGGGRFGQRAGGDLHGRAPGFRPHGVRNRSGRVGQRRRGPVQQPSYEQGASGVGQLTGQGPYAATVAPVGAQRFTERPPGQGQLTADAAAEAPPAAPSADQVPQQRNEQQQDDHGHDDDREQRVVGLPQRDDRAVRRAGRARAGRGRAEARRGGRGHAAASVCCGWRRRSSRIA